MKLNTQILKGLKTLNESFQAKNLINPISSILDTQSTNYLNKKDKSELLMVPFIGLDNYKFYESQGISPNQVVKADKAIKQAIVKHFKEYGKINPDDIECYYFESNKGKFKFKKIPGKFSIYVKFDIQVGDEFEIHIELPVDPNDITSGIQIVMGKNNDIIIFNHDIEEFCKNAEKLLNLLKHLNNFHISLILRTYDFNVISLLFLNK